MDFFSNAIKPPRQPHTYVARARIERLLQDVAEARVVAVTAPAGYGKTTVLRRWSEQLAEEGRPLLWIAARAGVTSVDDFRNALYAATVTAGIIGRDEQRPGNFQDWLIRVSAYSGKRLVMVVDDAQLLSQEVISFIDQVVASMRDDCTTIIAARGEPRLKIARYFSLGNLISVGVGQLSFSQEESMALLRQEINGDIGGEQVESIVQMAQGWAGGLIMAARIWKNDEAEGRGHNSKITSLRYEFAAYFQEEVVEQQDAEIRNFIVNTSILDELTPGICAAVTADPAARTLLERVFSTGLFLTEVDREQSRYRYHPLFKEMILGRLLSRAPERAAELQKRASIYHAGQKEYLIAAAYAEKSGDQEFVADYLNDVAEPMIYSGLLYRIEEMADLLPWDIISGRPNLLLALGWRLIRRLSFKSAAMMVDRAGTVIEELHQAGIYDDYLYTRMQLQVRHRRVMLAAAEDKLHQVEKEADELLSDIGGEFPYLSCTLLAQLMTARRELYHFHDMVRLEAKMRNEMGRPDYIFASIALKAAAAPTLSAHGKTDAALQYLIEAQDLAHQMDGQIKGLSALPAMPLAEIYYDRGELDEATALVEKYLPSIRQWGFVDQLASGFLIRARLCAHRGEQAAALAGLEEAYLIGVECGLDRLRAMIVAEQVRILIQMGNVEHAEQLFRHSELYPASEPIPTLAPTRFNEWLAIAWLMIEIHNYRFARSRKVAKRWLEFTKHSGAQRSAVNFCIILAQISALSNDRPAARRFVREAVELAEVGGWVSPFIDAGEVIGTLLAEAYASGPLLDSPVDRFAAHLLTFFTANGSGAFDSIEEDEPGLGSGLSRRELVILSMVGGGLRNREVGDRLGLTEGTVKWYMQQIYDKLGVRRRPQAVLRARQLGLLA